MGKYLTCLSYTLRHKWYVFLECRKLGITWQGITHDMSKFRLREFIPYAKFFYSKPRDKTGYYKPTDTGNADFDFAWLLHQKINKHHWQWWILPEDCGKLKVLSMPEKYRKEMIADWIGAGKAQGFISPVDDKFKEVRKWYISNRDKMNLHPETRTWIEDFIEVTL